MKDAIQTKNYNQMCPHGLGSYRLCSGVSFYVSWPFSIKMEERIMNTTANYFIVFDWNEMGGMCAVCVCVACVFVRVWCVSMYVSVCVGGTCVSVCVLSNAWQEKIPQRSAVVIETVPATGLSCFGELLTLRLATNCFL